MALTSPSILRGDVAFALVSTPGLPLATMLAEKDQKGLAVDWMGFAASAMLSGWSQSTVEARVAEACNEVYGPRQDWTAKIGAVTEALLQSEAPA